MSLRRRWLFVVAVAAFIPLAACAKPAEVAATKNEPVKIDKIPGTDARRLTLDARAAERIGLKIDRIGVYSGAEGEAERTTVPYAAVLYEAKGTTFVYTSPERLIFIRQSVVVDFIEGDTAVLTASPPRDTPVVTAGGSQLIGIEFGVGK